MKQITNFINRTRSVFNLQTTLLTLGMILFAVGMGIAFGLAACISVAGLEFIATALIIDHNADEGR